MGRYVAIAVYALGLLATSAAWGAYVEYQGPSGNLSSASNWYVITDSSDPTSRTGETRLPVIGGTLTSWDSGDDAILRNGTTTTLNVSMGAGRWSIGGPLITGQPTGSLTTVYVPSGSTLSMRGDDPYNPRRIEIGGPYPGTLTVNGGNLYLNPCRGGGLFVGTAGGATGTMNLSGGTVQMEVAGAGSDEMTLGEDGGNGVINQSGGLLSFAKVM